MFGCACAHDRTPAQACPAHSTNSGNAKDISQCICEKGYFDANTAVLGVSCEPLSRQNYNHGTPILKNNIITMVHQYFVYIRTKSRSKSIYLQSFWYYGTENIIYHGWGGIAGFQPWSMVTNENDDPGAHLARLTVVRTCTSIDHAAR